MSKFSKLKREIYPHFNLLRAVRLSVSVHIVFQSHFGDMKSQ